MTPFESLGIDFVSKNIDLIPFSSRHTRLWDVDTRLWDGCLSSTVNITARSGIRRGIFLRMYVSPAPRLAKTTNLSLWNGVTFFVRARNQQHGLVVIAGCLAGTGYGKIYDLRSKYSTRTIGFRCRKRIYCSTSSTPITMFQRTPKSDLPGAGLRRPAPEYTSRPHYWLDPCADRTTTC